MSLINFKINYILTCLVKCFVIAGTIDGQVSTFEITDTKHCAEVKILSTQDNEKVLQQLKSGFKCTINWNKYQLKVSIQARNKCLDYLIDPNFQGVNTLFVLPFEYNAYRKSY